MRSKRYLVDGVGVGGKWDSSTGPCAVRRGQSPGPHVRPEVPLAVGLKSWLRSYLCVLMPFLEHP